MARKRTPSEKPPAFQFYARDWLASTRVRLMGRDVRGDYVDLLSHQWLAGALPGDPDDVRELLARPRNEWERVWRKLEPHFPLAADGARRNERLERVRSDRDAFVEQKRTAGLASAEKRQREPNGSDNENTTGGATT